MGENVYIPKLLFDYVNVPTGATYQAPTIEYNPLYTYYLDKIMIAHVDTSINMFVYTNGIGASDRFLYTTLDVTLDNRLVNLKFPIAWRADLIFYFNGLTAGSEFRFVIYGHQIPWELVF